MGACCGCLRRGGTSGNPCSPEWPKGRMHPVQPLACRPHGTAGAEPSAAASVGAAGGSACAGDGGSEGGGGETGRGEWKWGGVEGETQRER